MPASCGTSLRSTLLPLLRKRRSHAAGVPADAVQHAVFGNVLQSSSDAVYGARHIALKAGVPVEVPALTVNRLCGSGIQAAISAAQMILLGEADIVLTGGTESMSQVPHVIRGLRSGLRLGQGQLEDSLWSALLDTHCGCTMAATAENCATKYGISREAQDEYAVRSQQLAARAWAEGRFEGEVVPVRGEDPQGRRARDSGRPSAARHDDGDAGDTAAGIRQERLRDRGQRVRHRRRRCGAGARLRTCRPGPRPDAAGAAHGLGDCRCRPCADGHGPGTGDTPRPRNAHR